MASDKSIEPIPSAVMVLHEQCSDCLILTKRSSHLRHHPGEVCFPGGRWEFTDEDLYATALRELHEELNISPHRVQLIKPLLVEKTLLGSIIHPWFASILSIHPYQINTQEVDRLITIPISAVYDRQNYKEIVVQRGALTFKSLQFIGHEEYIWGATARIMCHLQQS